MKGCVNSMANLLERLRAKDKKGLFKASQTSISYPTGFLPFDFKNGYTVEVMNDEEQVLESYASTGIRGGTFLTVIGKTGTAKTTFIIQTAFSMVKPYENGLIVYYDLEQVLSYTRVKKITGASQKDLKSKFVLRQDQNYIEDIFDSIVSIAKEKEENKSDYTYDTGLKDEFGDPIKTYVPTVVVLDSIPTLASRDTSDAMEGSTLGNRNAKIIAQFYKRLMPIIKQYNITVMAINHINAKIEINPFAKSQPQVMYLKMDESVPGGNAPLYYANNLLKFISSTKFTKEKDGFDGFLIRMELLKSRTNKAGQSVELIYTQEYGFDAMRTLYNLAENSNLIEGRNPYRYVTGHPEIKFDSRDFAKAIKDDNLKTALLDACMPVLKGYLGDSANERGEDPNKDMADYMTNVLPSLFDGLDEDAS